MRILIYKRTHTGDPDHRRKFGNEGCMGRVRNFRFDAVIGVGGVSGQPTEQGISGKVNWLGRHPKKSPNFIDPRGPLVSFGPNDFRLFEQQGPLLSNVAPLLYKKVYGSRARFIFRSLSAAEQKEAEALVKRALDLGEFDHLQLNSSRTDGCKKVCRRVRSTAVCTPRRLTLRCTGLRSASGELKS